MSLNRQAFRTRTITAIVFAVVMLLGLLWSRLSLVFLFTLVYFGCWWEYFSLAEKIHKCRYSVWIHSVVLLSGAALLFLATFHPEYAYRYINIGGWQTSVEIFMGCLLLLLNGIVLLAGNKLPAAARWMIVGGYVYISLPIILMIDLRSHYDLLYPDVSLEVLPCGIVFSIWINDTMAYIVGSLIGKTPFSKISAKKTWEGTIGGALLCIIVIALLGWYANTYPVIHWVCIATICAVFGTLGDLLESKLKRLAGVKDSGHFMPGHGGFLDRFDSLLVATTAVWLYVYFFIR